jgi:hypothetical protein
MARLLHDLALPWEIGSPRHLMWLRIVDETSAPSFAFSYREIDSTRQQRYGFLEVAFPLDFDFREMAAFAQEVLTKGSVVAGIGGYQVSWDPAEAATGQGVAYSWCRRFLGLDMQDADAMAWAVPEGLPGSNWLTVVGQAHADRLGLDLAALETKAWTHDVKVVRTPLACIVQAGPAPTWGDCNTLEVPWAYAEVAHSLAEHFVPSPPAFLGEGWAKEPDRTRRWFRRLAEPEAWE